MCDSWLSWLSAATHLAHNQPHGDRRGHVKSVVVAWQGPQISVHTEACDQTVARSRPGRDSKAWHRLNHEGIHQVGSKLVRSTGTTHTEDRDRQETTKPSVTGNTGRHLGRSMKADPHF